MQQRLDRNRGFTLLELTCALFIITVAGFGTIQLYNVGVNKILVMQELDVASELLRNEMETLRAMPFDMVTSGDTLSNPSAALTALHRPETTIRVADLSPGLKEVSVTLKWQSRHGRWIERALVTRVARKGEGA